MRERPGSAAAAATPERARAFWAERERQLPPQTQADSEGLAAKGKGPVDGALAPLRRANAPANQQLPAPWDTHAWGNLLHFCTLRNKRRSRARTPAAEAAAVAAAAAAANAGGSRSHTPSSLGSRSSSGRTTPTASLSASASASLSLSPSHSSLFRMASRTTSEEVLSVCSDSSRASRVMHSPHRYRATCWLEPRPVPVRYSSTVVMKVGSTKKRYLEEVTFQTRLMPRRFSESISTATLVPSRRFTSVLEIQCLSPAVHIISLDELYPCERNGVTDEVEI